MKHHIMIQLLSVLVSLFFLFGFAFSQNSSKDVVYLKNGSVIRGEIVEQIPNKSIKIQTSDGSIFVYEYAEIEKITKESNLSSSEGQSRTHFSELNNMKSMFSISGGISIPVGDFASTDAVNEKAGYAKTGFTINLEYDFPIENSLSWPTTLILTYNSMDEDKLRTNLGVSSVSAGPILGVAPVTGIGFQVPMSPEVSFKASVQIGLAIGYSPEINFHSGVYSFNQLSATSAAFAYGFSARIQTSKNLMISFRYCSTQQKFSTTQVLTTPGYHWISTGTSSRNVDNEQPASSIQLLVGIGF